VPSEEGRPIPDGAVVGGHERESPLYVCRAPYKGGLHPGKIVAGKCNITWGGEEVSPDDYQVLTGDGYWAKRGTAGAYVAGLEAGHGLYLCRAHYVEPDNGQDRGVHPGKVVSGKCNIGYRHIEVLTDDFEYFYQRAAVVEPSNPSNNPANAIVSGNFQDGWIEHNEIENGRKGMRVHVRFVVTNGKGVPCRMIAYFLYEEGKALRAVDPKYRTTTGTVSASENLTPTYDAATFDNFRVFVPYDALNMGPGKSRLKFNLELYDNTQRRFFAKSDFYHFTYSGSSVAANSDLLNGAWKLVVTAPTGDVSSATLTFQPRGGEITAVFQSEGTSSKIPNIVLSGLSFSAVFQDEGTSGNVSGRVDGNQMVGSFNFVNPVKLTLNFVGTRTTR
jgi:hypothetical protein